MPRTKNARATIVAVRDEALRERARIRHDLDEGLITAEGARQQFALASADHQWASRLQGVEEQLDAYRASVAGGTAVARARAAQPTQRSGVEWELFAARTWDRHRRVLDSLEPVAASHRMLDLIRGATGDERAALLQEVDAYLTARDDELADNPQLARDIDSILAADDPRFRAADQYETHAASLTAGLINQLAVVASLVGYDDEVKSITVSLDEVTRGQDDDLILWQTERDLTAEQAPAVPGAQIQGANRWDAHEEEWVDTGISTYERLLAEKAAADREVADAAATMSRALTEAFASANPDPQTAPADA